MSQVDMECFDNQLGCGLAAARYAFVDVEVGVGDGRIHDIGAVRSDGAVFHSADRRGLIAFLADADFVCGHNIVHHDAKYLFGNEAYGWRLVDTLYLSPLLFPERPYHRLLKDDKLVSEQLNNPVNDCAKARDLLMDEAAAWWRLPAQTKAIYATLLAGHEEFVGFLAFVGARGVSSEALPGLIRAAYRGTI